MPPKKPTRRSSKPRRRAAPVAPGPRPGPPSGLERVAPVRELFWHNVLRELLASLSVLSAQRDATAQDAAPSPQSPPARGGVLPQRSSTPAPVDRTNLSPMLHSVDLGQEPQGDDEGEEAGAEAESVIVGDDQNAAQIGADPDNIFDGRMAVITALGQRIAIAAIQPVFACGVRGRDGPDWLSTTVECTVFEIRTPGGQAFTLPVHEIRCFHSLTPELLDQIRTAARAAGGSEAGDADQPFGFAAYTSLARSGQGLGEIPPVAPKFEGE